MPAARVGDMAICVGPPDRIAKGSSSVIINNKPAARMGDRTAHGGIIVSGMPTVLIGDNSGSPVSPPPMMKLSPAEKMSSSASQAKNFTGQYKSKVFDMPDMEVKRITYQKRDRAEYKQLRTEFSKKGGRREQFLKKLAETDDSALKSAGLKDTDLLLMKNGKMPEGDWAVHHKIPIDDGGNNDDSNLVLIKNKPSHHALTTYQKQQTKGLSIGGTKQIDWPMPKGKVYPKTPDRVKHPDL
ncbi:MAG: hypothetical protein GY938_19655 [Ketobacter sp.]|nr:hypothetical protein [Ketobacter sp.]